MVELFPKHRAIGDVVESAKSKHKWWESRIGDDYEIIEDIHQLLSQNEVALENFDCMDDYLDKMVFLRTYLKYQLIVHN